MGSEFEWYDYAIFTIILLISFGVGVFFTLTGGKQKTADEYLLANRRLGILPVCMSTIMSTMSAILVLGSTAEVYTYGIQSWIAGLGISVFYFLGIFMFIPYIFPLGVTSATEILELRFKSKAVRLIGTVSLLMGSTAYMGLAMYTPSTAIAAVTPIPWWASIIVMGVVVLFYTTMGGIKAVAWADVIQGFIYLFGLLLVTGLAVSVVGGFGPMWEACDDGGRIYVEFTPDPMIRMSFWSAFFGSAISGINFIGFSQTAVQRYSSMENLKNAKMAMLVVPCLTVMAYVIIYLLGMCMFAYYHMEGCDPLRTRQVANSNQLLPYFVMDALDVQGIPGFFIAILFSGALSSVSTSMNGNTAVTWKDLIEPYIPPQTERRKSMITKLIAFCYGLIGVGLGFGYNYVPGHAMMIMFTINGALSVPLMGLLLLGAFFPFANVPGAIVGAAAGFVVDLVIVMGNTLAQPWALTLNTTVETCPSNMTVYDAFLQGSDDYFWLWGMAYQWYQPLGVMIVLVVGILVSLCTGYTRALTLDPRYVAPVFDNVLCCLPESVRKPCRCGVRYKVLVRDDKGFYIKHDDDTGCNQEKDIGKFEVSEDVNQHSNEGFDIHL